MLDAIVPRTGESDGRSAVWKGLPLGEAFRCWPGHIREEGDMSPAPETYSISPSALSEAWTVGRCSIRAMNFWMEAYPEMSRPTRPGQLRTL